MQQDQGSPAAFSSCQQVGVAFGVTALSAVVTAYPASSGWPPRPPADAALTSSFG